MKANSPLGVPCLVVLVGARPDRENDLGRPESSGRGSHLARRAHRGYHAGRVRALLSPDLHGSRRGDCKGRSRAGA
jgi:hypothetical protein